MGKPAQELTKEEKQRSIMKVILLIERLSTAWRSGSYLVPDKGTVDVNCKLNAQLVDVLYEIMNHDLRE